VSTQLIVAEGIRSSLTCPLIANGKPLGFLFFSSREKNTYRDLHQDIFLQIAGQVSVLIEKSQLYQQIFELNRRLIEAHQQLKEQSMRDALTGALNRGAVLELLENRLCLAGRQKQPVTVIMADIDHFKAINDSHGHLAGDAVLRAVVTAIDKVLRDYDRVGRYGGEEFLIILDDTGGDTACQIAERIRKAVEALEVLHEGKVIRLSLSQGVALAGSGESPNHLLSRADAALYRAKREGRNRCCLAAVDER
jgi:diguanylate cyclase (GGDEF)-like protein